MLLLSDAVIRPLLDLDGIISAVESAFAAHGRGETLHPGLTHTDASGGEFHVKTGGLKDTFGAKINGAFPPPPGVTRPSIRGMIALFDATDGTPLAILDSGAITAARTGAATAVAARHLANQDSSVATIVGAGTQARSQLTSLARVLPLRKVFAWSRSEERARAFAKEMSASLDIEVKPVTSLARATPQSHAIVTCTPSADPLLAADQVSAGTFVAAVGSDSPSKQELSSDLVAAGRIVPDVLEQCLEVGELHHAVEAGVMSAEDAHLELGKIVAGLGEGRTSPEEIFIFDSTGTAMQDVAAAIALYRIAIDKGLGTEFAFRT